MSEERHECGHTDTEHEEMHELEHLIHHTTRIVKNPRVALIIDDTGEVHFVTTIAPSEAAAMLEKMAERVRRYGGNYVHDHFDRGEASRWN
jgi:hypothetical protein